MQARAAEKSVACRFGGCAPLLRIVGSLLTSAPLISGIQELGLISLLEHLLYAILRLSTDSLRDVPFVVPVHSDDASTSNPPTAMHDLLAATAIEVVAISLTQLPIQDLFRRTRHRSSGDSVDTDADVTSVLEVELQALISAAIERFTSATTQLPRLPEAMRRLYGALQRHDNELLMRSLQANAVGDAAAKRASDHLVNLAKPVPPPSAPPETLRSAPILHTSLAKSTAVQTDEPSDPSQSAAAIAGMSVTVAAAHPQLPRVPARMDDPLFCTSYPVLPPVQSFERVSLTKRVDESLDPLVQGLPEPPPEFAKQLHGDTAGGVPIAGHLGMGEGDRQLVVLSPLLAGSLVIEYCGEAIGNADEIARGISQYKSIWPPQLYVLRVGETPLALDISRTASFARFAEHCAVKPTCELKAYRTYDETVKRWVPRVCLVALYNLGPGDIITLDYTSHAVGSRESHIHADWILQLQVQARQAALAPPQPSKLEMNQASQKDAKTARHEMKLAARRERERAQRAASKAGGVDADGPGGAPARAARSGTGTGIGTGVGTGAGAGAKVRHAAKKSIQISPLAKTSVTRDNSEMQSRNRNAILALKRLKREPVDHLREHLHGEAAKTSSEAEGSIDLWQSGSNNVRPMGSVDEGVLAPPLSETRTPFASSHSWVQSQGRCSQNEGGIQTDCAWPVPTPIPCENPGHPSQAVRDSTHGTSDAMGPVPKHVFYSETFNSVSCS